MRLGLMRWSGVLRRCEDIGGRAVDCEAYCMVFDEELWVMVFMQPVLLGQLR